MFDFVELFAFADLADIALHALASVSSLCPVLSLGVIPDMLDFMVLAETFDFTDKTLGVLSVLSTSSVCVSAVCSETFDFPDLRDISDLNDLIDMVFDVLSSDSSQSDALSSAGLDFPAHFNDLCDMALCALFSASFPLSSSLFTF